MSPPLISKAAARYTGAGGREHCSLCRHFSPRRGGRCARVLGDISPMGWCRLFSREMRGLVADASSFNGGAGGPALSLDFMTPGTLDPAITFTRASTATYFDAAGVMQTAATNTPRWDYDPVTLALRGMLIEEARTNVATNSRTASLWTKTDVVVTDNSTISPEGTANASLAVEGVAGTALLATNTPTITPSSTVSFSAFLKRGNNDFVRVLCTDNGTANGVNVWINLATGAVTSSVRGTATNVSASSVALPNGWFRVVATATLIGTSTICSIALNCAPSAGSAARVNNGQYYVFGGQIEAGASASSYIPTTGASAPRAADSCTMSTSPWLTDPLALSYVIEATQPMQGSPVAWVQFDDGTVNNRSVLSTNAGALNLAYFENVATVTTVTLSSVGNVVAGVPFKGGVSSTAGQHIYARDGVSSTPNTNAANPPVVTTLRIGKGTNPTTGSFYVRRVSYWSRALSVAELRTVTSP